MSISAINKALLVVCIAFSLLGLTRLSQAVHPRYDSGAYIIAAKSIAQGAGLVHLAHPEHPPFTTYPPVIPVILAPFAAFAKEDFLGLKIGMVLLFMLTLFAFAFTFKRFLADKRILFAVALFGSGSLLAFAGRLQGEVPFTLFGLLAIFFADRYIKNSRRVDLFAMLATLSLLCNSRQAGIAWVAGICLAFVFAPLSQKDSKTENKRRILAAMLVVLLIAVPWALLIQAIQPGSLSTGEASVLRTDGWDQSKGHIDLFSIALLGRIKMNLFASATFAPESLFYTYDLSSSGWTRIIFLPVFLLMLAGFLYRMFKERSVLEGVTLAYCGLIFVTPWLREPRFFTVILPLLIVYLSQGVDLFAKWVVRAKKETVGPALFAVICTVIVLANLAGVLFDNQVNPWSAKNNEDYELAKFAEEYLPEGAVVLAHDHCAFYLLTGNKSLSFTPSEQKFLPQYKLDSYLAKGGRTDYITWTKGDQELVERFLSQNGLTTHKIAQDNGFFLHQIVK